jgi:hypothetical protein
VAFIYGMKKEGLLSPSIKENGGLQLFVSRLLHFHVDSMCCLCVL